MGDHVELLADGRREHRRGARAVLRPGLAGTPKIVFSTTLEQAGWNTTIVGGDLASAVAELKAGSGKDMQLTGGTGVAKALADLDLIDEYQVVVHPVVLGGGQQLFPQSKRFSLKLEETRTFDGATVLLRYTR